MKKSFLILFFSVIAVGMNAQFNKTTKSKATKAEPLQDNSRGELNKSGNSYAEGKAKRLTAKMTEHLTLTKEQNPKIYDINFKAYQKIAEAKEKHGSDKQAMGKRRKAIEEKRDAEFKDVLTQEQYDKWQKLKQEKKDNKKKGGSKPYKGGDLPEDSGDGDAIDDIEVGRG